MSNRINRKAIALEVGGTLRQIAKDLSKIDEYSGDARKKQLENIASLFNPMLYRLQILIDNCRAAEGSYPNYPRLRKVITEAGDKFYELKDKLENQTMGFQMLLAENPESEFSHYIKEFARIGQELRVVRLAPALKEAEEDNAS